MNIKKNADKVSKEKKHVAVVILNYNGRDWLKKFLPDVVKYTHADRSLCTNEVIVIDNASTDKSLELLNNEFSETVGIVALTQNYGFSKGYNEGLKSVKADFFVLLNSDVEVTNYWLSPVLRVMLGNPAIAAAQPKILAYNEKCIGKNTFEYAGAAGGILDAWGYPLSIGRIFDTLETDREQYDCPVRSVFWASGAAMFVRSEVWHKLGGLDPHFFAHMEEIDFCWRVKRAGYEVVSISKSIVYHVGGGTLDYLNPRKTFLNFRNNLAMIFKNETTPTLLWLLPLRLILDGVAGLKFLLEKKWAHVWAILCAHWAFYQWIPRLIKEKNVLKNKIAQHRIAPDNSAVGRYKGSIVLAYFLHGKKHFSDL